MELKPIWPEEGSRYYFTVHCKPCGTKSGGVFSRRSGEIVWLNRCPLCGGDLSWEPAEAYSETTSRTMETKVL